MVEMETPTETQQNMSMLGIIQIVSMCYGLGIIRHIILSYIK